MFSNEKNSKKLIKYSCESCDFTSSNKNDYTRHINTIKHKNTVSQCFSIEKTQKNSFNCECGKIYKDYSGLWRHKKKCIIEEPIEDPQNTIMNTPEISPELIMSVLQQNKELQTMLMEQNKTIIELSKNNSITNNSITNNKLIFKSSTLQGDLDTLYIISKLLIILNFLI